MEESLQEVLSLIKTQQKQIDIIFDKLGLKKDVDEYETLIRNFYNDECKNFKKDSSTPNMTCDEFLIAALNDSIKACYSMLRENMDLFYQILESLFYIDFKKLYTAMSSVGWTYGGYLSIEGIVNTLCELIREVVLKYSDTRELWYSETGGWRVKLDEDEDGHVCLSIVFAFEYWEY